MPPSESENEDEEVEEEIDSNKLIENFENKLNI